MNVKGGRRVKIYGFLYRKNPICAIPLRASEEMIPIRIKGSHKEAKWRKFRPELSTCDGALMISILFVM